MYSEHVYIKKTECFIQACFTASASIASHTNNLTVNYARRVDRNSTVGIATRYGLDGLGMESRWGARFSLPVHTGRRAHPASCTRVRETGYWVSFPGVKRPGRDVDHPPPSIAEVKKRVELYLYSLSGPSWSVLG